MEDLELTGLEAAFVIYHQILLAGGRTPVGRGEESLFRMNQNWFIVCGRMTNHSKPRGGISSPGCFRTLVVP
jgi:hypothetical protein